MAVGGVRIHCKETFWSFPGDSELDPSGDFQKYSSAFILSLAMNGFFFEVRCFAHCMGVRWQPWVHSQPVSHSLLV